MRVRAVTVPDWILAVTVAIVLSLAYLSFRTSPLSFVQAYRRRRGGRWARVSRGWIRIGDDALGQTDEDWRRGLK